MNARPSDMSRTQPLFGYQFSTATMDEIVARTARLPEAGQGVRMVVTANLDHIVQLQRNTGLRDAYRNAWFRTIDGMPVWLYSKMRGAGVTERVTGADLLPCLAETWDPTHTRLYFVASSASIAKGLFEWAQSHGYPPGSVAVDIPPFGFEHDPAYSERLTQAISDHGTTHLLFGLGCPKSEIWINDHRNQLGDVYAFAIGAALAFFVGEQRRAPVLVRKFGFEWMWRVYHEPDRLAQRYFLQSWGFTVALLKDLRGEI